MPEPYSLLRHAWIPVVLDDGRRKYVRPCDVTSRIGGSALIRVATGRPDCDISIIELLIGLLAVAIGPEDRRGWSARYRKPPAAAELNAAFARFEAAMFLDGAGPRLFQDLEPLEGESNPIEGLFIDAPGGNTKKENADHFVKRGRMLALSRAGAAIALATLQTSAPSGGAGHRTSLRGGGPLTTLVIPGTGEASEATLWERLWANVPTGMAAAPDESSRIFPWTVATRVSDKDGKATTPDDVHRAQAFFGLPRRIRLAFEPNQQKRPCDLLGIVDDIIATGYVTRPWGTNYTAWSRGHPLSPYYKMKPVDLEFLPLHLQSSRVGYRQWLGMVMEAQKGLRVPAHCVAEFRRNAGGLPAKEEAVWRRARMLVAGFTMDNMKPLGFAEAQLPLFVSPNDEVHDAVTSLAQAWIEAADTVASQLVFSVNRALYGEVGKADRDSTVLEAVKSRFWSDTETEFYTKLRRGIDAIEANAAQLANKQDELRREAGALWLATLKRYALAAFDDTVAINAAESDVIERVITGRKMLMLALTGYGSFGTQVFSLLNQPAVETKGQEREVGCMRAKPYESEAKAARDWLAALRPEINGLQMPGDRATLAKLRRAATVMDAAVEAATVDLYKRLRFSHPERDLARAALIAAVLAHVRGDTIERVAVAIGAPRGGADYQPKLTPLRFKRLLAARTPDDLLIAFRRLLAILGDNVNVRDLAGQLVAFTDPDENKADIARTRFAFDYYSASPFAPGTDDSPILATDDKD